MQKQLLLNVDCCIRCKDLCNEDGQDGMHGYYEAEQDYRSPVKKVSDFFFYCIVVCAAINSAYYRTTGLL